MLRTESSQRLHHVVGVRGVSGGGELVQVQGRLLDQRFPIHCVQLKETQKTFQIGDGGKTGYNPLSLPGGFPAANPEPAVRCDGGRAAQRPLLYREPHFEQRADRAVGAVPP